MATKPFAIEIVGLEKHFGSALVLDQLSLSVVQNELLVILGESGSGKSTLLKLIAGLEKPQHGCVRFSDVDQARVLPHMRDVAVVFQNGNGYEHLSVRQNLDLAAKKSSSPAQVIRWVDSLKLGNTLKQRLNQLSGGQLQRVAIARAILSGKSIVLLDEPLAHLNQSLREEMRELILMVHKESKRTFVYVTHDSDEAFYLANRIAVLDSGRIQQVGEPRTVYCMPSSKEVARLLGQPTIDILQLPSVWFDATQKSDATVQECGLRSNDWTIHRIETNATSQLADFQKGLSITAAGVILKGTIVRCRWMGNRWMLEIECPERVRITCDTGDTHHSTELQVAEELSRSSTQFESCGFVEASIPLTCIQTFGGNRPNGI